MVYESARQEGDGHTEHQMERAETYADGYRQGAFDVRTQGNDEDRRIHTTVLLVSTHDEAGPSILRLLSSMRHEQTNESETRRTASFTTHTTVPVAVDSNGLRGPIPSSRRRGLPLDHCVPDDVDGPPYPGQHEDHGTRIGEFIPRTVSTTTRNTTVYRVG